MSNKIRSIFALGILLLAGCQRDPGLVIPTATPRILRLEITPASTWILPEINKCQQETPGLNLTVHEKFSRQLNPKVADLLILSGEPDLTNSVAVEIGKTSLKFIVNPANAARSIPIETLRQIFAGQISQWSDIEPSLPSEDIQVWLPPSSDEMWDVLKASLLDGQSISDSAKIAPDPNAMLASVAADKYAIGLLPQALLNQSVKTLKIQPEMFLPIIAVTQSEPQGLVREFLLCLQSSQIPCDCQP